MIWKPSRKNITFVNEEGKKVRDGKNYSSFYDSNHFHDFFKSMRIEPEQEQEQLVEQVAKKTIFSGKALLCKRGDLFG